VPGKLSAGRLGKKFATVRNRVINGKALVNAGEKGGSKLWDVRSTKPAPESTLPTPVTPPAERVSENPEFGVSRGDWGDRGGSSTRDQVRRQKE
jgi:hypothetical protein